MKDFFTYKNYKNFLKHMQNISKITTLANWSGGNCIILRHDVDFDIKAAYNLSQIEKRYGIESTYFIRITGPYYNPLFKENRKMLGEMANDNFELGLHFDPTVYNTKFDDDLKEKAEFEVKVLESITLHEVESISLHNPSVHGQYLLFDGYKNGYDTRIFSDDSYLSDSRMSFRGKDPYEFVKNAKNRPVQITLHPIHYSEDGGNYLDIFTDYFSDLINNFDKRLRINSTYSSLIANEKLIDYLCKKKT